MHMYMDSLPLSIFIRMYIDAAEKNTAVAAEGNGDDDETMADVEPVGK